MRTNIDEPSVGYRVLASGDVQEFTPLPSIPSAPTENPQTGLRQFLRTHTLLTKTLATIAAGGLLYAAIGSHSEPNAPAEPTPTIPPTTESLGDRLKKALDPELEEKLQSYNSGVSSREYVPQGAMDTMKPSTAKGK